MKTISILDINAFLYYESRLLDDEQWDEWLNCYSPDAEFWMPSWDDNDELVTNPQEEISLIDWIESVNRHYAIVSCMHAIDS